MVPHAGTRILCTTRTVNQVNADTVTNREYHLEDLLRIMMLLALMDESGAAAK